MSYVASLELCKELYELSGWADTELFHVYVIDALGGQGWDLGDKYFYGDKEVTLDSTKRVPAYSLGYLLRKLPAGTVISQSYDVHRKHDWHTCYVPVVWPEDKIVQVWDDTPEDAICKLAIELFKQGAVYE